LDEADGISPHLESELEDDELMRRIDYLSTIETSDDAY
jgi:hypothetical protein